MKTLLLITLLSFNTQAKDCIKPTELKKLSDLSEELKKEIEKVNKDIKDTEKQLGFRLL